MRVLSDYIVVTSGQSSYEAWGFVLLGLLGLIFFWLMIQAFKIHVVIGLALLALMLWLGFAFWLPAMIDLGTNMVNNPTY